MDIRLKLKEIRKKKKISQQAVADFLGTTQTNYSDIENLKTRLSLDDFAKICKLLDVEPFSLMIGSDEILIKINKDQAEVLADLNEQIQSIYNLQNLENDYYENSGNIHMNNVSISGNGNRIGSNFDSKRKK